MSTSADPSADPAADPTTDPANDPIAEPRAPLTKQRVLRAAVELADRDGLAALTMRNLAQELGYEAMSLYHHLANKDALLDGVVDMVVEEIIDATGRIDGPSPEDDWKTAMRLRILTAREVLLRHPWAPGLIESRTRMSMPIVLYFEGVLAIMRASGMSFDLAHHGMHALGSRAIGFTQELFAPDDVAADETADLELVEQMAPQIPNIVGMMEAISHETDGQLGWCDDQAEFEFGLEIILDGLDRRRAADAES